MSYGSDLQGKNTTMFEFARRTDLPGMDAALAPGLWYDCFYFFSQKEYSSENFDFLRKIDQFKASPGRAAGEDLYAWTKDTMNLSGAAMTGLNETFGADADKDAAVDGSAFDGARTDAVANLTDVYARFESAVAALKEEFPVE